MTGKIGPTIPNSEGHRLAQPPESKWSFTICGDWHFHTLTAPNRFHRIMQRLVLGIRWRRL